MFGDELDDLREDLSGLPLERRIGVEEVRDTEGRTGRESEEGKGSEDWVWEGEGRGEDVGNGTDAGWLSKEERILDFSRRGGR